MIKYIKENMTKKKVILNIVFWPLIILGAVGIGIGNDIAFNKFANHISALLSGGPSLEEESVSKAKSSGNMLAREIVKEGAVLVKNENNTLPLDSSITKMNVFGHSSVDWYMSGGGSGAVSGDSEPQYTFPMALENNGISYNHDLYSFYYNYRAPVGGANPVPFDSGTTAENYCVLAEPRMSEYDDSLLSGAKTFSNVAAICISRKAGESEDVPHAQYKFNQETDYSRGYLSISTEEEALLDYVCANFSTVIVLINSTNVMDLSFVPAYQGIDACLICGATGNYGANGIYDLLYGASSPSGRTADTYPYKLEYAPSFYRGGYEFVNYYEGAPSSAWPYHRNYKGRDERKVFYVDYVEGIYVGYKWFETADAEGFWDKEPYNGYENVVLYPFGFGLSYTTFSWEIEEASLPEGGEIASNLDVIEVKIKVTNTGDFPGKDVVEVYATPPYYQGGIEKAHRNLVGFAKTAELEPGQSTIVNIPIRVSDLESYDCYDKNSNGHKGYELEEGKYTICFMEDSHTPKQGMDVNELHYSIVQTINVDFDEVTNQPVGNLFTGEEAVNGESSDGSTLDQNVAYLTREHFELPTSKANNRNWDSRLEVSPSGSCVNTYSVEMRDAWDARTGKDAFGEIIPTDKPSWGSGSGPNKVIASGELTELGKELASPENWQSQKWNSILDQISWNEAMEVIDCSAIGTNRGIDSAGRPDGSDADGPLQIGAVAGISGTRGTAYPAITVTGQTWSTSLAYAMGKSYGADMEAVGRSGAYAFGCNIHRSAYTGRNFEYFSEDGFLSGKMAANASKGVAINGKYCFMKHFACNDQEYHRTGLYTWVSEQAMREIYLKPFKEAVLYGELTAIMSSFNRIGPVWSGGNEALLTGVLRREWRFHGMVITDYCESDSLMDQAMVVRAGGDYGMAMRYTTGISTSLPKQSDASPRFQWRVREICKEIIYGYIRPLLVNAQYNENADVEDYIIVTKSKKSWDWWKPTLISVEVFIGAGMLFGAYLLLRPIPKKKEEENAL